MRSYEMSESLQIVTYCCEMIDGVRPDDNFLTGLQCHRHQQQWSALSGSGHWVMTEVI